MSNSRKKGIRGEQELCRYIEVRMGMETGTLKRNWQEQSHSGGHDITFDFYAVECKRQKATPTQKQIEGWWNQTMEQSQKANLFPLLCFRPDRGNWLAMTYYHGVRVTMLLDDFLLIVKNLRQQAVDDVSTGRVN